VPQLFRISERGASWELLLEHMGQGVWKDRKCVTMQALATKSSNIVPDPCFFWQPVERIAQSSNKGVT